MYINSIKAGCIFLVFIFSKLAFSDGEPSQVSGSSSFLSSMNQILFRSTDISLSELNLEEIRSKNLPKRLYFLPTFSLTGTMPVSDNFLTPPRSIGINSKLNLFRFGADYLGLLSSKLTEESKKYELNSKILIAEREAVGVLITEIQRMKEVEISSKVVQDQVNLLGIAQERYQRGYLPFQEVEKLMIDLENSKASLADSKMNEAQARAQLEKYLGQFEITLEWPWVDEFRTGRGATLIGEDFQLNQRSDWLSAQKDFQAQEEKLNQNWRLLFPSIDAQFSYGNFSGYFGSLTGWSGTISMTIPLFDQLTSYSDAKAQIYLKMSSEVKLEKVQREARSQWESSRANFQIALETALVREKTLELSKKLYQDNLNRFQVGRMTANDLTLDRNRMNSAERFTVQAWAAVHLHFTELCHSLGYRVSTCISRQ